MNERSHMYDLVVHGGAVVSPSGVENLDIGVEGERIAAVVPVGALESEGRTVIDATGCFVIPGGVDPHVHHSLGFGAVRAEPQKYSPAAGFGGTTTIIDFAFQEGDQTLHDAVAEKKEEASGEMAVDYGFHALLSANPSFEVLDEIGDVIRNGVPTIKALTTYGWMSDDGHIWGMMNEVAENGGLSIVHAEDDAIANWLTQKYLREGKTHGAYIAETRGPLVEEAAVRRMILLAERSGSPLYVFHVAAGSAALAIGEARARDVPIYGETLIAYLSFTSDKLWDDEGRGLLWNNYPVIKSQEDQDILWQTISDDRLQAVSSDHFATSAADRFERMGTTIDSLQAGQASVEMRVPVLFHLGVHEGRIGIGRFVELISTNPAKIMGLYPRKGVIAVDSDADLVVIDPNRTWTVHAADHHMSSDYNCWEDWELRGRITTTVLRGTLLVEDGAWVGPKGGGRYVERHLLPEVASKLIDFSITRESLQEAAGVGD
jgi:dihydropyrimidinase